MEIRGTRPTEVVVDVRCNRCGRSCRAEVPPAWDGFEYGTLRAQWGYGSKEHDGESYELHLCEGCFFGIISEIEHDRFLGALFDEEPYLRGFMEQTARLPASERAQPLADAVAGPNATDVAPLPPSEVGLPMEAAQAERYARVALLAGMTFGDTIKARKWLTRPLKRFEGCSPLAMAATEEGAQAVEDLLILIASGTLG